MADQPYYRPLEPTTFFDDGRSQRPQVEGTIARGQLELDEHFYRGRINGELATTLPVEVTRELLARGQNRFNIFCSPCHDRTGSGRGMIVQRGYHQPPSYHIERLREAPVGHFFDVASNGFRLMPDYAAQVTPADRWAIVAYIRALQYSQHAPLDVVPREERDRLEGQPQ
jgi:mono/diheme cytochrome c family protein